MPDSLVIAELIETLGQQGGVQSTLPSLQNTAGVGATFQLLAVDGGGAALGYGVSYDLGAPQPTTDIVQSLLLDGERPFGYRASNRTIKLPIIIKAPDQVTMAAAREVLMQLIDQQTWTLMWTPAATGLPLVFDCFRANPTIVTYGFLQNRMPYSVITLEFQALPYGRNDPNGLVQIPFTSPLVGGVASPPAPVVLDNFGTVSGSGWSSSASKFVVGPHSAHYTPGAWPQLAATYTYPSTFNLDITGRTTLSVWFGQSYDTTHFGPWPAMASNVTLTWTLTDNLSHTLSFHKTYNKCPWSNDQNSPMWTRITAAIPQTSATFNYTDVQKYKVVIQNWVSGGVPFLARIHAWLDAVTANPPSLAQPASQRGTTYTLMGITGTARTPVSCQFQLPQSGTVSTELQGTGLWWPPIGVTAVQAECVGAGGAGGSRTTVGLGGGGGGGEYAAEAALTVAAGTPVPYSCGVSGAPGAIPQVVTFTTPGTGNWYCPVGVTTVKAECWGGGAGGAPGGGGGGGGGYGAEASLTVTAGKTYQFLVGSGGSGGGTPGAGNSTVTARNGGWSKFIGDSVTVTGFGGYTGLSGGTTGGAASLVSGNTTHYAGGAGGTAPSYGGGGGGSSAGTGSAGNTGSAGSGNTGGAGGTAVTGGAAGGVGANNPGWPGAGVIPGGGGGGGFSASYNGGGGNGASGKVQVTYTINAGTPTAGGNTTFGSTTSTGGVIVTAHGGSSAALNSTTGAAGGTGSSNGTHHNGGAGFTAVTGGGGGGGSGGSASVGTTATSNTGAAAVAGGGKGANGGTTGTNDVGDSAALPGGGGGGACETSTPETGGVGGAGGIVLTWTPPLAQWGTLIAHRPGQNAPNSLNPCVPINNTADAPSSLQYSVPSLIAGTNALFNGTYSVVLVNYNWDNPTAARQITVTVTQYEYGGGTPGNMQSLSYPISVTRTITPSTDILNGICLMGELTLPVKDIDPSNTSGYFTVSITDTDIVDQFLDVLFLDTQGQTVLINLSNNTYTNFFIDEPTSDRDLGRVMGSDLDRSQAISVLDSAIVSGGPFYVNPGDNAFFIYSPSGTPNLGVNMIPRWYLDRLV